MKLALVINAHADAPVVADAVDAARRWATEDLMVLVDGASWERFGSGLSVPAVKACGLWHAHSHAPYRNLTLGLMEVARLWPGRDWYGYCEYDVLFASPAFKEDLAVAAGKGVWCLGNDHREDALRFPYLERIVGAEIRSCHYLLGCCVFYSGEFVRRLVRENFFGTLLHRTNGFANGFFPGAEALYDFGEYLYPTLAIHYGGRVGCLGRWDGQKSKWGGRSRRYPMRFRPELGEADYFPEASILHPVKGDSVIRRMERAKRNASGTSC